MECLRADVHVPGLQGSLPPSLAVGLGRGGGHFNIQVGFKQQATVIDRRWEPAATIVFGGRKQSATAFM